MATPVSFPGSNHVFGPPKGQEDSVSSLETFVNGACIVSCWQLSPEELAEVNRAGGRVYLSSQSGLTLFPVYVGSGSTVRDVVGQFGPTIPSQEAN